MELGHSVFGARDGVAEDVGMAKDFIVVAAGRSLITEEVDSLETFALQVIQAESLIPALGENINGNLATDGELKSVGIKALSEFLDKLWSDVFLGVKISKSKTLIVGAVTADRRNVDHSVAVFDKGSPLDGNLEVGEVVEDKL